MNAVAVFDTTDICALAIAWYSARMIFNVKYRRRVMRFPNS